MYEACHWIISVEDYKYRDDTGAYIELQIEKLENAVAYIYHGTDRHNATTFIENNQTAVYGAPFRIPISTKLIVVMYTIPNGLSGSGHFSYQLYDAEEYAWYFEPFVGEEWWLWTFTLVSIALLPFIVLAISICCCMYCSCCQKCCSGCLISRCCRPEKQSAKEYHSNKVNVSNEAPPKQV